MVALLLACFFGGQGMNLSYSDVGLYSVMCLRKIVLVNASQSTFVASLLAEIHEFSFPATPECPGWDPT